MAGTGRFYPNLSGVIPHDAEQSIYRLFDDVYQLRAELGGVRDSSSGRLSPSQIEQVRQSLESTGDHPINIVNLVGGGGDSTPHTVLLWEEQQSPNLQVWLSPANILVPAGEAKVIVGADLPVGVNGSLIPDFTATTGFRSQTGMAFNLGVFNTEGNFAKAIDTKWGGMFIGSFTSGLGGPGFITRPLSLWNADHVGTGAVRSVGFSSVTNPGNISINVNNAAGCTACGAAFTVTNGGGVRWSMGISGGTSQATSNFCISSAPSNTNPCTDFRIAISGLTGDVTLFNNLIVNGSITASSGLDFIQFEWGGTLLSGGASNLAVGSRWNTSITAFAGDIAYLAGMSGENIILTAGAAEVYASVSQLRLQEPNINLGAGDSITIAATLEVVDAPTEGVNNYSIHVGTGLTSVDTFEHRGVTLGFFGTAPVAQTAAYTITNVTPDRAYDANATSVAELADVLGTLIADLTAYGLLQ